MRWAVHGLSDRSLQTLTGELEQSAGLLYRGAENHAVRADPEQNLGSIGLALTRHVARHQHRPAKPLDLCVLACGRRGSMSSRRLRFPSSGFALGLTFGSGHAIAPRISVPGDQEFEIAKASRQRYTRYGTMLPSTTSTRSRAKA